MEENPASLLSRQVEDGIANSYMNRNVQLILPLLVDLQGTIHAKQLSPMGSISSLLIPGSIQIPVIIKLIDMAQKPIDGDG